MHCSVNESTLIEKISRVLTCGLLSSKEVEIVLGHLVNYLVFLGTLLARCGQVHLVFHSDLSELGHINYRPIMVKQLNCRLIPQ